MSCLWILRRWVIPRSFHACEQMSKVIAVITDNEIQQSTISA